MEIIHDIATMRQAIMLVKKQGQSIGSVLTMGYLHQGHSELIRQAQRNSDFVVVSIFINPLQFDNKNDLAKYPKNLLKDQELCQNLGVDVIFAPSIEEMYPNQEILTTVNIKKMDQNLCGRTRIGHFHGVCTVVSKLFNIIQPDMGFWGQKDIQQVRIIDTMVHDLNLPIKIIPVATVREGDGLALSSRNIHLSKEDRQFSVLVPQLLQYILGLIQNGLYDVKNLLLKGQQFLKDEYLATSTEIENPNIKLDYLEIVDYQNLQLLQKVQGKFIIATAIFIGNTRLIDNVIHEI